MGWAELVAILGPMWDVGCGMQEAFGQLALPKLHSGFELHCKDGLRGRHAISQVTGGKWGS